MTSDAARPTRFLVPLLVLAIAADPPLLGQEVVLNPGRVLGNVEFLNPSSAVLAQCSADLVVPPPWGLPITLRSLLDGSVAAQASYTPSNTASGTVYVLGTFDVSPNVPSSGSNFLFLADPVHFASRATYRFGTSQSSGAGAHFCTGVLPTSVNPAGTRCDVGECAVLLNVRFRFVGAAPDLAGLDSAALARCTVWSTIPEPPTGGTPVTQASSGETALQVQDLISGYKSIPLLVRGNTQSSVGVSCKVPVAPGQAGYVLYPGTNLTPVSVSQAWTTPCALTGPPTPASTVTLDILVARTAGSIRGLLDVNGYVEENARISIGDESSLFVATAQVDPANPAGALKWSLDGVPQGNQTVSASTLLDQRDKFVIFPQRAGLNLRVPILAGALFDLGATFVARPAELKGRLTLFDFGASDLSALQVGPFSSYESVYSRSTSFAEARGNPSLPQSGGASGIGGLSRGRLRGSYVATTGRAELDYHLLLPGIGQPSSALDGSQARNTSWDFNAVYVGLGPSASPFETLSITPGMLLRIDSGSPPSSTPLLAPPQSYCFGRTTLTIKVDPAVGALFYPYAGFQSTTAYQPVATGTTPVVQVSGHASQSVSFAQRGPTVSLPTTLLAGLGYWFWPGVQFAPAGSTSEAQATYAHLPSILVPGTGVVGCASDGDLCYTVSGPNGPVASLSVDILDASGIASPTYCLTAGPATFTVKVSSSTPSKVESILDPTTTADCTGTGTQVLCSGNCIANPQFSVSFASLTPGGHKLRVCASDTLGCDVSSDLSFRVENQNVGIACPAPITITLGYGEASLARTDPRIAPLLQATVSGTCGIPPAVSDNAPPSFVVGTTTVTFSAPDVGTCSTTVTVQPWREPQIAVRARRAGKHVLEIYQISSPTATLRQTVTVGKPFAYSFSPVGSRVAVATTGGRTGVVDLTGGASSVSLPASATAATSVLAGAVVAWHHGGQVYAVLGKPAGGTPVIHLLKANPAGPPTLVDTLSLPVPSPFVASQLQLAAMSFSPDGSQIVIAGSGAVSPQLTQFKIISWSADTDPNGRIVPSTLRVAVTPTVGPDDREEVREIGFDGSKAMIAATRTVYALAPVGSALTPALSRENLDAAFGPDAKTLALTESVAGRLRAVRVVIASGVSGVSQPYGYGSSKGEIAVSADGSRIGVAARTGIVVYDDAFAAVSSIPDPTVFDMHFRPGS